MHNTCSVAKFLKLTKAEQLVEIKDWWKTKYPSFFERGRFVEEAVQKLHFDDLYHTNANDIAKNFETIDNFKPKDLTWKFSPCSVFPLKPPLLPCFGVIRQAAIRRQLCEANTKPQYRIKKDEFILKTTQLMDASLYKYPELCVSPCLMFDLKSHTILSFLLFTRQITIL